MAVNLIQHIGAGNGLKRFLYQGLRIYSEYDLTPAQQEILASLLTFESKVKIADPTDRLSGRAVIRGSELEGIGKVVAKSYRRGGIFKSLLSAWFMRWNQTRCRLEYKILQTVRSIGVHAPEPLAYIEDGEFWYRAWLVTREIPSKQSLLEVSRTDEQKTITLCQEVGRQIGLLVRHGIYHIDLHPGNVVIGTDDTVYLVDFDKAYEFDGPANVLRDLYLRRWRRAVIKHKLPDLLSEVMSLQLRQDFHVDEAYA